MNRVSRSIPVLHRKHTLYRVVNTTHEPLLSDILNKLKLLKETKIMY